ncbi:MAG: scramblase [Spirochaetes bacterium]|nr:scramblase [Spirochaetota bacterium]
MTGLEHIDKFIVQQQKEWGEILTGFETKNRYKIFDSAGNELFYAFEDKGNWLIRQFLQSARPLTMQITDKDKNTVLQIKKPFRWIFPEVSILDTEKKLIGTIKKRFTFFRRLYSVFDSSGHEIFQLFGPILKPWTFHIMENSREVGKVTKKWSGAMKEIFTTADNFGAEFPVAWSSEKKYIALGAVFLIDLVHFEYKG